MNGKILQAITILIQEVFSKIHLLILKRYEDKFMEEKLQIILKEYMKEVEYVCNILLKNINSSENLALKNKYDFFQYRSERRSMEFEAEGISYRLHGRGCMAFSENMYIDWDFGHRSRWCGIDPWKVSMTLKLNKSPYTEFYDGNLVQTLCERFADKGMMFKHYGQYYFSVPKEETFRPKFPKKYDTLIVEYFTSNWFMPKNIIMDRFIRKSIWVHNQIYENRDNYILKFLSEGKEIFVIPYNDISYPENAVKIMNDVIIKNFLKSNDK